MKKETISTLVFTATLLWAGMAWADSFRCGTKLMTDGDSSDKVEALCGPPTSVQRREILRPVYWNRGVGYHSSYEVSVEYWTYNLGPSKLMVRIRFEDGLLVDIETLGHGYYSAGAY